MPLYSFSAYKTDTAANTVDPVRATQEAHLDKNDRASPGNLVGCDLGSYNLHVAFIRFKIRAI